MGPAAFDIHSKKYPTILTPKDAGQTWWGSAQLLADVLSND
jgi:hypothetical protein